MFCVSAMSANLRKADIDAIARSRIDSTLSILVDLLGACERIFKSPVPLVYTRHTARFLAAFLLLLPFGLFDSMGNYWNHWQASRTAERSPRPRGRSSMSHPPPPTP